MIWATASSQCFVFVCMYIYGWFTLLWQKPIQCCKGIILQLKKKNKKKKLGLCHINCNTLDKLLKCFCLCVSCSVVSDSLSLFHIGINVCILMYYRGKNPTSYNFVIGIWVNGYKIAFTMSDINQVLLKD